MRYKQPKYLLMLGLFLLGSGSTAIPLTGSFPVLLLCLTLVGLAFGFIDPSLNAIATLTFQKRLASNLNTLHGLFGLGPLLGPLILAFGLQFFKNLDLELFLLRRRGCCHHHHPVAPCAAATRTGTSSNERATKASSSPRTAECAQTGIILVAGLPGEPLCSCGDRLWRLDRHSSQPERQDFPGHKLPQ